MKNNKKRKTVSIKLLILAITTLPLLLACVIITVFASWTVSKGIETQVLDGLKSAATGALLSLDSISAESFNMVGDDLYKGDYNVSQNMDGIDYYAKSNDVEITFFYNDTRRATTIKDSSGSRIVGTKADTEVIDAVLKRGEEYSSPDVLIQGGHYYGYYMPIKDTEGNIIGMAFAGRPGSEISHYIRARITFIAIIALINYISCVITATLVSRRRFLNPISKLTAAAEKLAVGDINQELTKDNDDEFGELTDSFTTLMENTSRQAHVAERVADGDLTVKFRAAGKEDVMGNAITKMIHDNNENLLVINDASERMTKGVQEIAAASNSLAQGTTQQASAVEEMTASIKGIADIAEVNAGNANRANELVMKARDEAERSNEQMQDMIAAMDDISKASENISKIMKIIDDIASQTNIISLNASVEAARAGVHGKGFAVVADEVRKLAGESAEAAKNSAEIIEDAIRKTNVGSRLAEETAKSLEEILHSVEDMTVLVNGIAEASSNQSGSVNQVNTGIAQIADVMQTNSATSQQCAATSSELENLARQLRSAVNRYKLKK